MSEFSEKYEQACSPLRVLGPKFEGLLVELLRAEGIRVHEVTHRVKEMESAKKKLARSQGSTNVEDLHDLLGLRVITYLPREVGDVARMIEQEFAYDPKRSTDKGELLDPDRFGYLSRHYLASLRDDRTAFAEYRAFKGCKVEIQIRSILQHAWAEIEHDLGYKSEREIPRDIRRRFSRLAGLLEVADGEFEQIEKELSERNSIIRAEVLQGTADEVELDADSLALYVLESSRLQALERSVCDATDIPHGEDVSRQVSIDFMNGIGIQTVGQLDSFISNHEDVLREFAVRWLTDDYHNVRVPESLPDTLDRGFLVFYTWYFLMAQDSDVTAEDFAGFMNPAGVLEDVRSCVAEVLSRSGH